MMNTSQADELSSLTSPSKTTAKKSLKAKPHLTTYRVMIAYRFALAAFGGYALAALSAMVIAQYFSDYRGSAAMSATLIAFILQAGAFIWVFMVNKTLKATLGIVIPTLILYIILKMLG